ncbi:MAG: hypothetical protein JST51_00320 [Armatimonadetes bacterium]|nr:hypothetical protein [Armatimonadota bacterium]
MVEFKLYRIKVTQAKQVGLFTEDGRPEFLMNRIYRLFENPNPRRGWVVGNFSRISEHRLLFRIGRLSTHIAEYFEGGQFRLTEDNTHVSTTMLVDVKLGLLLLASRSELATDETILRSFSKMLREQSDVDLEGIDFIFGPIRDPKEFVRKIKDAFSVRSLSVSFSKPNPPDTVKWIKLAEQIATETGARTGRVTLEGADMDRNVLEEIANSAARTGDAVDARIQNAQGEHIRKISADKNILSVQTGEHLTEEDVNLALNRASDMAGLPNEFADSDGGSTYETGSSQNRSH